MGEGADSAYVVCWMSGGTQDFIWNRSWRNLRRHLDSELYRSRPWFPDEEIARLCSDLGEPLGGFPPSEKRPVGAFHVAWPSTEPSALVLVRARGGGKVLPMLGKRQMLKQKFATRWHGVHTTWFTPASSSTTTTKIRSIRRATVRANLLLDETRASGTGALGAARRLTLGELVFVAQTLRDEHEPELALAIADVSLELENTTEGHNLRGAALRDMGRLHEAVTAYQTSIELSSSAEFNPYAYVGLAATLRRLGDDDAAWDALKKPLHHHPDDPYARELHDAMTRSRRHY